MKIRIFSWEEALKAGINNNDTYAKEGLSIFGIDADWEYWGKTVDNATISAEPGLLCYVVDGLFVPYWACEFIPEPKAESKESREIPQGWFCPRCGRIVSPFVDYCNCEEK